MYKHMDINKIFKMFENEEVVGKEFKEYTKSPYFMISAFKKFYQNRQVEEKYIEQFIKSIPHNVKVDPQYVRVTQEKILFERTFNFLRYIDVDKEVHIHALKELKDKVLILGLEESLYYFENKEVYENCAIIKKILDKIKSL